MMTEYYQLKMVEISEFDEVNKILLLFIQNQLHLYIFHLNFCFSNLFRIKLHSTESELLVFKQISCHGSMTTT